MQTKTDSPLTGEIKRLFQIPVLLAALASVGFLVVSHLFAVISVVIVVAFVSAGVVFALNRQSYPLICAAIAKRPRHASGESNARARGGPRR